MRQFYLTYPHGSALARPQSGQACAPRELAGGSGLQEDASGIPPTPSAEFARPPEHLFSLSLSWSHYCLLINIANAEARSFYEIEAAREGWSVRELERQIGSLLFDRLTKSRDNCQATPSLTH